MTCISRLVFRSFISTRSAAHLPAAAFCSRLIRTYSDRAPEVQSAQDHLIPDVKVSADVKALSPGMEAQGLGSMRFSDRIADVLLAPVDEGEVEIRPDGLLYYPVSSYRDILNKAFGPGGWGLKPLADMRKEGNFMVREYELWAGGRLVSTARGETSNMGMGTGISPTSESCKSDALKRCCKDLGVASQLYKPSWVRKFKASHCVEVWAANQKAGGIPAKKLLWRRKDSPPINQYPWVEETRRQFGTHAAGKPRV